MTMTIKTAVDIEGMRVAGRLASEVLDLLTPLIKPGVTTLELDRVAHEHMVMVQGTVPATLNYAPSGYPPYPASLCASINHEVCHGIPTAFGLISDEISANGVESQVYTTASVALESSYVLVKPPSSFTPARGRMPGGS